jgi:hypothetical protein
MSNLIRDWLLERAEIDVDTGFADAFSDGTLLARLLHNLGQFQSIESIQSKAPQTNFALLRDCLKSMNVAYPVRLVQRIIDREPGAALTLLHSIKMEYERMQIPTCKQRKESPSLRIRI